MAQQPGFLVCGLIGTFKDGKLTLDNNLLAYFNLFAAFSPFCTVVVHNAVAFEVVCRIGGCFLVLADAIGLAVIRNPEGAGAVISSEREEN